MSDGEIRGSLEDRIADLFERLRILRQRVNEALEPDNLRRMGRTEIRDFLLILEEMKMIMAALEISSHFRDQAED